MSGDNDKVLRAVLPNAGIEAEYRRRLKRLIVDMQRSIVYWLSSSYKQNQPKLAQDDVPANSLQETMNKLAEQWQAKFDKGAEKLGAWFAQKTKNYTDGTLQAILAEAGFTVQFKMTETIRDAFDATIHEQVGLIKSISSEHLQEVQGLVMRSVQDGRNLGFLSKELQKRYGITKRRAAFIARDQNNKATSTINHARCIELGIEKGRWRHSHAGKHPRPSHVRADGEIYDLKKGMYIDGEWIKPGKKPGCKCTMQPIIPGFAA